MRKIGILIETKDGALKKTNFGVVTAARGDGHELYGFLIDGRGADHKMALEAYGIHKIVEVTSKAGPLDWNPASWSMALIQAMAHFGVKTLLGLTSAQGKDLLPRIAAALDAPLVMDCIDINLSEHTVEKIPVFGQDHRGHKSQRSLLPIWRPAECFRGQTLTRGSRGRFF